MKILYYLCTRFSKPPVFRLVCSTYIRKSDWRDTIETESDRDYPESTSNQLAINQRFYLTNRFGQEVISHMPEHRDHASVTPAQREAFQRIKEASAKADADLRDPVKHDEWLHLWHASLSNRRAKHYKTLRGFVIASYRQQS